MPLISNRDIVLLLIGLDQSGGIARGIGGITRLQKYLYLIEKEGGIVPSGIGFEFKAYKAGPYSRKLYDDLEFLRNLDLIGAEVTACATDEEAVELEELNFDDLMGDESDKSEGQEVDGFGSSDACEERRYFLTPKGRQRVEDILQSRPDFQPVFDCIRKVKSRFNSHSLSDLLYYVYTRYPDMTVESEIRDKVLRGRKRP